MENIYFVFELYLVPVLPGEFIASSEVRRLNKSLRSIRTRSNIWQPCNPSSGCKLPPKYFPCLSLRRARETGPYAPRPQGLFSRVAKVPS